MVTPGILGQILGEIFDDQVVEIKTFDYKKNTNTLSKDSPNYFPSSKERHTPIYQENWS